MSDDATSEPLAGGNRGARNGGRSSGSGSDSRRREQDSRYVVVETGATVCVVVVGCASAGLLTWASLDFRGTWSRKCDYQLKVWVLVTLSRVLVQMIGRMLLYPGQPPSRRRKGCAWKTLQYFLNLLEIFSLAWFLYGIKPVLVDTRCDMNSWRWGVALWSIQCILLLLPCLLICLLIPLICCMASPEYWEPKDDPTPSEVVDQLQTKKFRDVKVMLGSGPQQTAAVTPSDTAASGPQLPALSQATAGIQALTGLPIPDPSRQFRRMQSSRLGSVSGNSGAYNTGQNVGRTSGAADLEANTVGRQNSARAGARDGSSNEVSCPICFCEFEDEDELVLMPCDERHAFHKTCLQNWLNKSRACPICRADVVESVEKRKSADANDGKKTPDGNGSSRTTADGSQ